MRTAYTTYTIVTGATMPTVGWSLTLEILAENGDAVGHPLHLGRELIFATEALAHRAGVLLARYWIDGGKW